MLNWSELRRGWNPDDCDGSGWCGAGLAETELLLQLVDEAEADVALEGLTPMLEYKDSWSPCKDGLDGDKGEPAWLMFEMMLPSLRLRIFSCLSSS